MSEDLISSYNSIIQMYQRKLGAYAGSSLGNDIYYLKEFCDLSISDFGKEKVLEMLKNDIGPNSKRCRELANNWDKFWINWKKLDKVLNKAKIYWDKIEKKNVLSKDKNDVKIFAKYASYVPLIKEDLYTLAIFLIKNNNQLNRRTIPNEAFKVLEHSDLKKMDATRRYPDMVVDHEQIN